MARVCLTEKQKREAAERDAIKRMRERISDNMAVKMNRDNLNREKVGNMIGITRQSVSDILAGNDLRLNISTVLKILYFLGLEVT